MGLIIIAVIMGLLSIGIYAKVVMRQYLSLLKAYQEEHKDLSIPIPKDTGSWIGSTYNLGSLLPIVVFEGDFQIQKKGMLYNKLVNCFWFAALTLVLGTLITVVVQANLSK